MIIINEYDYVRQILEAKVIPKGVSNKRVLLYIAKYYFNPLYSIEEMKSLIFKKMSEFNLPANYYQEYKYDTYVKGICEKLLSKELSSEFRKVSSVDLYQSELDVINEGETDKEKKILFTLFVLAKINGTNSGWVNNEIKDIFQLANVTATIKERALLLHKLYKAGLIGQSKKNDKLGYKVELGKADDSIVLAINSFENIGNQYIANFKDGWKMCMCCGKLFKVKSDMDHSSKYCKQCAHKIKLEQVNQCKMRKKATLE